MSNALSTGCSPDGCPLIRLSLRGALPVFEQQGTGFSSLLGISKRRHNPAHQRGIMLPDTDFKANHTAPLEAAPIGRQRFP